MMKDAILDFSKQFSFTPEIARAETLPYAQKWVVCGMGGSHLAADLLRAWDPSLDIVVHTDYGLPALSETELQERLIIISSYSGNTEEALDAFEVARKKNLSVAALSVGGKLEALAKEYGVPFIKLPDTGIQPRSALGFSMKGMMKLMGLEKELADIETLANRLNPAELEAQGKEIAEWLKDKVPVIYSSTRFAPVAYNWKIKFNETGKIPAFYNTFPELNHNEMNGFDAKEESRHLSERFAFIFLKHDTDHPRVQVRMEVLEEQYKERGFPVKALLMSADDKEQHVFEDIFTSLLIADWTAVHTAEFYGLESEQVPMIEEFKKRIAG